MKHLTLKIFGDVQGVNFRYYAKLKAVEYRLSGFIHNESDGTVYVEAEGEEEKLKEFLNWCREGPRWARVDRVEFEYSDKLKNFKEFKIEY
jgi:acylphosphatase